MASWGGRNQHVLESLELWRHPCFSDVSELLNCPLCEDVYHRAEKMDEHLLRRHRDVSVTRYLSEAGLKKLVKWKWFRRPTGLA